MTGMNSILAPCVVISSSVYHTFVLPSFSGRPRTPTLMQCRLPGRPRCHLIPVWVTQRISARDASSRYPRKESELVDSQRNSLIFRGEPWQSSTRYPSISKRIDPGRVRSHALFSSEVFLNV